MFQMFLSCCSKVYIIDSYVDTQDLTLEKLWNSILNDLPKVIN